MKDPNANMDQQNTAMKRQTSNAQDEPRRNSNKLARVAFGPDLETHIPPRDKSPAPPTGHHRSFTTFDLPQPPSTSGRPTSSSAENNPPAVVAEERPRMPTDRVSDSGRPTAALKRAKSDYGPRVGFDKSTHGDDEEDVTMRHGWQEEYTSSEYLKVLHSVSRRIRLFVKLLLVANSNILVFFDVVRTFTCTSQRNVTKQMVFRETLSGAGQVRIGA